MDDILYAIMGIDKQKEIFNLWYEVNFLRLSLNQILKLNPDLHVNLKKKDLESCRKEAQEIVKRRFPNCNIVFNEEASESMQECPSCTPQESSEPPHASH